MAAVLPARGAVRRRGPPAPELLALAPAGDRRMSANPVANGGHQLRDLRLPDWREYGVEVAGTAPRSMRRPGCSAGGCAMSPRRNPTNFLTFAPDELASNRLQDILEVTGRDWQAEIGAIRREARPRGRVIEVLSEHMCQGLLEGYLLTGRHGVFTCYEAFIHIVDSMFNQHAKWLEASAQVPWRRPIASLNYLLSSHVWRQDHNGFTHQDPGFLDVVLNKTRRDRPGLPAARREHAAVHLRPLPAVEALRERRRRRQATAARLADGGRGRAALRPWRRHLGVGRK